MVVVVVVLPVVAAVGAPSFPLPVPPELGVAAQGQQQLLPLVAQAYPPALDPRPSSPAWQTCVFVMTGCPRSARPPSTGKSPSPFLAARRTSWTTP